MFTQQDELTRAGVARSGDYRLERRTEQAGRRPDVLVDGGLVIVQAAAAATGAALLAGSVVGLVAQRPEAGGLLAVGAGAVAWWASRRGGAVGREALVDGVLVGALVGALLLVVCVALTPGVWASVTALGGAAGFAVAVWGGIAWARYRSGVVIVSEEHVVAGALAASEDESRTQTLHLELGQTTGTARSLRFAEVPHVATDAELAAVLRGRLSVSGIREALNTSHGKAARVLAALTGGASPLVVAGSGNQAGTLTDEGRRVLAALEVGHDAA